MLGLHVYTTIPASLSPPQKPKYSFYEVVVSIFCNQCNELEYLMYLSVLFGNKYVIKFYFVLLFICFKGKKVVFRNPFSVSSIPGLTLGILPGGLPPTS